MRDLRGSGGVAQLRTLADAIRADAWWEHKLALMLGTGYATAALLHAPLVRLWPTLMLALVALAAAAAFVSLLNDLTDVRDDRAAGKPNRLEGRSPAFATAGLVGCLAVGLAVGALAWRGDALTLALYGGAWLAFSLYSIPPARLKGRGVAGVLADASGAH